jgi:DNA-binding transcriptional ArsR family regulator
MIRLVLRPASVGNIRFAVSPALETVQFLNVVARAGHLQNGHGLWMRQAIRDLASLDVGELLDTVRDENYSPDFLHPHPERGEADEVFARQMMTVLSTPPAQIERQLEVAYRSRSLDWVGSSIEDARELLVKQLTTCWERVVRPMWPRVEAIARTDIRTRSDFASSDGLRAAVNDLHTRLTMRDEAIEFTRKNINSPGEELAIGEEGIVLIPTVLGERCVAVGWSPGGPAQLMYWARGSGLLHESSNGDSALPSVLGATRVSLLAASVEPTTTKELAARLELAPATVSYHLTAMSRVGWLSRVRIGRSVEYEATELGRRILEERHES